MTRLLKLAAVRDKTSLSTGDIYARMTEGRFPKQIQLSPGRVAWSESEVNTWLDELIENDRAAKNEQ